LPLIILFASLNSWLCWRERDEIQQQKNWREKAREEKRRRRIHKIGKKFYDHIGAVGEGGEIVAKTDERREYVVSRVKRYFENPENVEHIKRMDAEHFANGVFGHIPPSREAKYRAKTFFKDKIAKLRDSDIEALLPLARPTESVNYVEWDKWGGKYCKFHRGPDRRDCGGLK
jgi:hypothetical protein